MTSPWIDLTPAVDEDGELLTLPGRLTAAAAGIDQYNRGVLDDVAETLARCYPTLTAAERRTILDAAKTHLVEAALMTLAQVSVDLGVRPC